MGKNLCLICLTSNSSLSYFRFPKNEERRNKWLEVCQQRGPIHKTATICSQHFTAESYTNFNNNEKTRCRLKSDAIPTLLLESTPLADTTGDRRSNITIWCFICGPTRSTHENEARSYHRFPKDEQKRNEWIDVCGAERCIDVNLDNSRVCSLHFLSTDFIQNPRSGIQKLKRDAVPRSLWQPLPQPLEMGIEKGISCSSISSLSSPLEINVNTVTPIPSILSTPPLLEIDVDTVMPVPQIPILPIVESERDQLFYCEKGCQTDEWIPTLPSSHMNVEGICDVSQRTPSNSPQHGVTDLDHTYMRGNRNRNTRRIPLYFNDITTPQVQTPRGATRCLHLGRKVITNNRKRIQLLRQKVANLQKKCNTLNDLIDHLKNSHMICDTAYEQFLNDIPLVVRELSLRQQKAKKEKYSEELRKFALTLQFYSTKAYLFVRRVSNNLLPHIATVRKWCCVVDSQPGISKDVLCALRARKKALEKEIICNLVIDEMSIKKMTLRKKQRRYGQVNLGFETDCNGQNSDELATYAYVFLLVALNDKWKVPLAYFLIKNLTGQERANLITLTLRMSHVHDVRIHSITFDGAPVNFTTMKILGARFISYGNSEDKFNFPHPVTEEPIFIYPDPSHMEKNVRNALAQTSTQSPFYNAKGEIISWTPVKMLNDRQNNEGLRLGNKLTDRHIKYWENPMAVWLAVQVLSNSVKDSLLYLQKENFPGFENVEATAEFLGVFNDIFDLLNCRTKYPSTRKQPWRLPLTEENYKELKAFAQRMIKYIYGLTNSEGVQLIHYGRKCGFIGLVICLKNIFNLFDYLREKYPVDFEYLLSYKLLQDMIENLFSCIRMMGGFNNNPNAYQVEKAIRRIIIHQEVVASDGANCLYDDMPVLQVSSATNHNDDSDEEPELEDEDIYDNLFNFQNIEITSQLVNDTVDYIGGYISFRFRKSINENTCRGCVNLMTEVGPNETRCPLIETKTRNNALRIPPGGIRKICHRIEEYIRNNRETQFHNSFPKACVKQLLSEPEMLFLGTEHDLSHKVKLVKFVTKLYMGVRMHHEENIKSMVTKYTRRIHTKVIHFQNQ